jgi:adhesin/invasin
MSKVRLMGLLALAAANVTCGDAPLTAPAGSSVFLVANPPFVVANGGVSVVTAIVTEPAGTFVPDGTEVFFFTNLGRIESSRQTKDGVARVNFVADSRSGTANVLAVSGGAPQGEGGGDGTDTVDIVIGSARPATVVVTANPQVIRSNGSSRITANVFDVDGNPVANVPIIFSLETSGTLREYLDNGGAPVFTDNNGQAFDTLRTARALADSAEVTVTATTPLASVVGSTTVTVN